MRDEKEELQKLVDDSEGVEKQLRDLTAKRGQREEAVAATTERLATLERLAAQAADLAAAAEQVRLAREEVLRIQTIGSDVDAAERSVGDLGRKMEAAEQALKVAQVQQAEADAAFESAKKAAGSDSAMTDTVARQRLELRKVAADQASREAQQQIDSATGAQKLVDAVATADREHRAQQTEADNARAALADAAAKEAFCRRAASQGRPTRARAGRPRCRRAGVPSRRPMWTRTRLFRARLETGDRRTRGAAKTTRGDRRSGCRCARADAPACQRSRRSPRRAERRARGHGDTKPPDRHPGEEGRDGCGLSAHR